MVEDAFKDMKMFQQVASALQQRGGFLPQTPRHCKLPTTTPHHSQSYHIRDLTAMVGNLAITVSMASMGHFPWT